jgi:hypothetical protein
LREKRERVAENIEKRESYQLSTFQPLKGGDLSVKGMNFLKEV